MKGIKYANPMKGKVCQNRIPSCEFRTHRVSLNWATRPHSESRVLCRYLEFISFDFREFCFCLNGSDGSEGIELFSVAVVFSDHISSKCNLILMDFFSEFNFQIWLWTGLSKLLWVWMDWFKDAMLQRRFKIQYSYNTRTGPRGIFSWL